VSEPTTEATHLADLQDPEAAEADVTLVEDDVVVEDDLLVEDISIDGMCGVY
jgi:mycofactocin precursor